MSGYDRLAVYYSLLFPLNDRQRGFFRHLLAVRPAGSVLDAGSGTGEHLAWFVERGLAAYALEPDPAMLRELESRSWPGPAPAVIRGGMELLPGDLREAVDLVLCLGNTLPHLPDRAAVASALAGMAACLRPGGRLALQTVNFDRVLREGAAGLPVIARELPGGGKITFRREYGIERHPPRIMFRTRLDTPEGEFLAAWPLLPLLRDELAGAIAEAGLHLAEEYGDYDRSPRTPGSPAHILVVTSGPPSGP